MIDEEKCPVLHIARLYYQLLKELDAVHQVVDGDDSDFMERLEELQEAISHLTASSLKGAAVQIWLAHGENDRTSDADPPSVQRASRRQVDRFLYRSPVGSLPATIGLRTCASA
jgi:hypothetical protein